MRADQAARDGSPYRAPFLQPGESTEGNGPPRCSLASKRHSAQEGPQHGFNRRGFATGERHTELRGSERGCRRCVQFDAERRSADIPAENSAVVRTTVGDEAVRVIPSAVLSIELQRSLDL